jgi:putative tricarboxylic transport membrane protein
MTGRLRRTLPYLIVLIIAGILFLLANRIEFAAPGNRIGPDFWPKVILGLALVTCAFQIVKTLFFERAEEQVSGVLESILEETPAEDAEPEAAKTYPQLIIAGIALTIAYVVAIEWLGFFLCTFVYLAAFAWIGRYRRPGIVLVSSLVGSVFFMFMFMKVVYVSLPLGREPFMQVSLLLMRLLGIR